MNKTNTPGDNIENTSKPRSKGNAIGEEWICHELMTDEKLDAILAHMTLAEILDKGGENLIHMSVSEIIFSEEQYAALGDTWKEVESTIKIQKIATIKRYFTPGQIIAIKTINLIDERMALQKIQYIGDKMTEEEIIKKTGEYLLEISIAELLLSKEQYNALLTMGVEIDNIQVHYIRSIAKRLTAEEILRIGNEEGPERITKLTHTELLSYDPIEEIQTVVDKNAETINSLLSDSNK